MENKVSAIVVRLTPERKKLFRQLAEKEGLRLSEWIREKLNRASAERVLQLREESRLLTEAEL